jgi:hypothetical protein
MRTIALAVLLATPLLANAGLQNLVVNGGFEATNQNNGSWNIYQDLPGWTGGIAGIELRNNVAGTASEGHNFVELDTTKNSSMWQSFSSTAGQHFTLSFDYSPRPGVATASNGIEVLWNNTNVATFTQAGGSLNAWSSQSFDLIGAANSSTLLFRAIGVSDSYGGSLDNVRLTTAPIPEPETWAMMMLGMGALGVVARRRAKAQQA